MDIAAMGRMTRLVVTWYVPTIQPVTERLRTSFKAYTAEFRLPAEAH